MTASGPSCRAVVGTWPRSQRRRQAVAVALDDGPLEVRAAEVEPEVAGRARRRLTAPVTTRR